MLVLTRKKYEKINIDGGIVITIADVVGGKVKVGIDAPPHVKITRAELPPEDGDGKGKKSKKL